MIDKASEPQMIAPDKALPGRNTPMPNIEGSRHAVLGTPLTDVPEGFKAYKVGSPPIKRAKPPAKKTSKPARANGKKCAGSEYQLAVKDHTTLKANQA